MKARNNNSKITTIMGYNKEMIYYIKNQETRPDWNRDKICTGIQVDKVADNGYVIYDYINKKVIAMNLDSCNVHKHDRPSGCRREHTCVVVTKNGKINFFVPFFNKERLIFSKWALGSSPQCCMGNKFSLRFADGDYKVNFDKSSRRVKGKYNMWTIDEED